MKELSRIVESTSEIKKSPQRKALKIVRKLNLLKKAIRKKTSWNRRMKREQIRNINTQIENELKQHKAKVTMKMAKSIQTEDKMHSGTFYEFKRRMARHEKGETPSVQALNSVLYSRVFIPTWNTL